MNYGLKLGLGVCLLSSGATHGAAGLMVSSNLASIAAMSGSLHMSGAFQVSYPHLSTALTLSNCPDF